MNVDKNTNQGDVKLLYKGSQKYKGKSNMYLVHKLDNIRTAIDNAFLKKKYLYSSFILT